MNIHRTRFLNANPATITHLKQTPSEYPNPLLAVCRSTGYIELWSIGLRPLAVGLSPDEPAYSVNHRGKDDPNWVCIASIPTVDAASTGSASVESIQWAISRVDGLLKPRLFAALSDGWVVEIDIEKCQVVRKADSCAGSVAGAIWSMAVCGKGDSRLAIGCEDGSIRVFDISDEDRLEYSRSFDRASAADGQLGRIVSLAATLDGEGKVVLYSGSSDGVIRIWDFATGRCTGRINVCNRRARINRRRREFKWDDDEEEAALAVDDEAFFIWSLVPVAGNCIAPADSLGAVRIWDCRTKTLVQSFVEHEADVLALCTDETGEILFAGGIDPKIVMFYRSEGGRWYKKHHRRIHTHDIRAITWIQQHAIQSKHIGASLKRSGASDEEDNLEQSMTETSAMTIFDCLVSGGVDTQLTVMVNPRTALPEFHSRIARFEQPTAHGFLQLTDNRMMMANTGQTVDIYQLGSVCVPAGGFVHGQDAIELDTKPRFRASIKPFSKAAPIHCACISPCGQYLFVTDGMSVCKLLQLKAGSDGEKNTEIIELQSSVFQDVPAVKCAMFLGTTLILACTDFSVRCFDVEDESHTSTLDLSTCTHNEPCALVQMTVDQESQRVAVADFSGHIYIIDCSNPMEPHLKAVLPRLETSIITTMQFARLRLDQLSPSEKDVLFVASSSAAEVYKTSNHMNVYDVEASQFLDDISMAFRGMKWLAVRKQRILQIAITEEEQTTLNADGENILNKVPIIYLNGASWLFRVDLHRLMASYARLLESSEYLEHGKKTSKEIQHSGQAYTQFVNMMFFGILPLDKLEAVAVERPWRQFVQTLPPPFAFKKFGVS